MPVTVGLAQLERIEEQHLPVPFSLLTPAGGGPAAGDGTFQFSNHSWLVRADGLTILVDPCNGNGRRAAGALLNDLNLPWLDRLRAAGAAPRMWTWSSAPTCTAITAGGTRPARASAGCRRSRGLSICSSDKECPALGSGCRRMPTSTTSRSSRSASGRSWRRARPGSSRRPSLFSDSLTVETAPGTRPGTRCCGSNRGTSGRTSPGTHSTTRFRSSGRNCACPARRPGPGGGHQAGAGFPSRARARLPFPRSFRRAALRAGRAAGGRLQVHARGYRALA